MRLLRRALEDDTEQSQDPAATDPATTPETTPEATPPATEPAGPKLEKEKELVFYAKIANFEQLKDAKSIEHQEQFEVKIPKTDENALEGRIRVRMTVKEGKEPKYEITTKTKLPDGSEFESDAKTTVENFIQFQYMANGGMVKDRYEFKVEGQKDLVWEVDVFTGADGVMFEWCKIDLEYEGELPNIPPFPIELKDVITNQNGQRTPEEEATVRTLYDTVFKTPNPFLAKSRKE